MACKTLLAFAAKGTEQLPVTDLKQLYLDRKYRHCISRGTQILSATPNEAEPLQAAYANFYVALSHDALAHGMNHHSNYRVPTLELAERYYVAALRALPDPLPTTGEAASTRPKSRASTPGSRRSSFDSGFSEGSRPSTATTASTAPSSPSDGPTTTRTGKLFQKTVRFFESFSGETKKAEPKAVEPTRTALKKAEPKRAEPAKSAAVHPLNLTRDNGRSKSAINLSSEYAIRCAQRYNAQLSSFKEMLESHIASAQESKRAQVRSSSLSTFGNRVSFVGDKSVDARKREMSPEERAERIRRGRDCGWKRPRFEAERYEQLCEKALEEL